MAGGVPILVHNSNGPGPVDVCIIPTLKFKKTRMPNIANGVEQAQAAGAPVILNRETDEAVIDAQRAAATRGFTGSGSPDEYPFASSKQGGAGATITDVPLQEQRRQGGTISAFYRKFGIQDGDPFRVMVVP